MNVHSTQIAAYPELKRAVAYIRCSTDMQAETSPEQQKEIINDWAIKHHFSIIDWYNDVGKSGTSFEKRPEFNRLLSTVRSKPAFSTVIVLDETRWGRAGADDSNYYKILFKKEANVDVVMVRSMAQTGNATIDSMLKNFEGSLSREESQKKSERTYDGCKSAAKKGRSAGGWPPYGYRRVAVNIHTKTRRVLNILRDATGQVIFSAQGIPLTEQIRPKEEYTEWEPGDPEEVNIVKKIFELRVSYKYGYTKIANYLNGNGIKCVQRGRWSNKDQKWSQGTIRNIIINPSYRGARVYDRVKKNGIGRYAQRYRQYDKTQWTITENAHPAIIDPAQWFIANQETINTLNGSKTRQRFDNPYLLSGLIKCSHCGFNFNGRTQLNGSRGNRKKKRMYIDSAYISKGPSVCSYLGIDAERLEGEVVKGIKDILNSTNSIAQIKKMIESYLEDKSNSKESELERIHTEINNIEKKISSLVTLAERGINLDQITDRLKELQREKDKLSGLKKEYLANENTIAHNNNLTEKVAEFFRNFEYHFNNANPGEKKALINQMVERIVIDRENKVAKCFLYRIPRGVIEEILQQKRGGLTPLLIVLPTGIEPVLQA